MIVVKVILKLWQTFTFVYTLSAYIHADHFEDDSELREFPRALKQAQVCPNRSSHSKVSLSSFTQLYWILGCTEKIGAKTPPPRSRFRKRCHFGGWSTKIVPRLELSYVPWNGSRFGSTFFLGVVTISPQIEYIKDTCYT